MPHDTIIAIGQFLLLFAPVSMLVGHVRCPVLSSALTGLVLVIFGVTFADLGLFLSSTSSFMGGVVWLLLALQELQRRPEDHS